MRAATLLDRAAVAGDDFDALDRHVEEIGGDYVSVNVNGLDDVDPNELEVIYWVGRHDNWEVGPRQKPWPIISRFSDLCV